MILKRPQNKYVYLHYLGLDIKYVGRGSNERVFRLSCRPDYDWDGYKILAEELTEEESRELEDFVIETIGLDNLANRITGTKAFKGKKHSEESKEKMRKAKLGKKRPDVAKRNKIIKKGQDPWVNRRKKNLEENKEQK